MELDYKLPFSMTQVILHGKLYGDNFSDIQRYLIGIHGHFSTHRVTSTRRKKIKKEERGSGEEGERFFFFFSKSSLLSLLALTGSYHYHRLTYLNSLASLNEYHLFYSHIYADCRILQVLWLKENCYSMGFGKRQPWI